MLSTKSILVPCLFITTLATESSFQFDNIVIMTFMVAILKAVQTNNTDRGMSTLIAIHNHIT